MDIQMLQEVGLTSHESKVYVVLLEVGETKTGAIVKKTGLHRVIIYDALESLIKKGLASYVIKENIKYFQAASPDAIISFIEEKKKIAENMLPSLKQLQKESIEKQSVTIYEGVRGLKTTMSNMLKELSSKDEHYVFASGNMEPTVGSYYYIYQKEKKAKRIATKVIYDASFKNKKEIINATYGQIRFYSFGPFPTDTWIYKDKVLIVTYTAKPPVAVLINSKETANSYKRLFEGYWKQARR